MIKPNKKKAFETNAFFLLVDFNQIKSLEVGIYHVI